MSGSSRRRASSRPLPFDDFSRGTVDSRLKPQGPLLGPLPSSRGQRGGPSVSGPPGAPAPGARSSRPNSSASVPVCNLARDVHQEFPLAPGERGACRMPRRTRSEGRGSSETSPDFPNFRKAGALLGNPGEEWKSLRPSQPEGSAETTSKCYGIGCAMEDYRAFPSAPDFSASPRFSETSPRFAETTPRFAETSPRLAGATPRMASSSDGPSSRSSTKRAAPVAKSATFSSSSTSASNSSAIPSPMSSSQGIAGTQPSMVAPTAGTAPLARSRPPAQGGLSSSGQERPFSVQLPGLLPSKGPPSIKQNPFLKRILRPSAMSITQKLLGGLRESPNPDPSASKANGGGVRWVFWKWKGGQPAQSADEQVEQDSSSALVVYRETAGALEVNGTMAVEQDSFSGLSASSSTEDLLEPRCAFQLVHASALLQTTAAPHPESESHLLLPTATHKESKQGCYLLPPRRRRRRGTILHGQTLVGPNGRSGPNEGTRGVSTGVEQQLEESLALGSLMPDRLFLSSLVALGFVLLATNRPCTASVSGVEVPSSTNSVFSGISMSSSSQETEHSGSSRVPFLSPLHRSSCDPSAEPGRGSSYGEDGLMACIKQLSPPALELPDDFGSDSGGLSSRDSESVMGQLVAGDPRGMVEQLHREREAHSSALAALHMALSSFSSLEDALTYQAGQIEDLREAMRSQIRSITHLTKAIHQFQPDLR